MPDPKKPTKLNRTDYRYCATCEAVVHKDHVTRVSEVGAFWDPAEPPREVCPKGHTLEPVEAEPHA